MLRAGMSIDLEPVVDESTELFSPRTPYNTFDDSPSLPPTYWALTSSYLSSLWEMTKSVVLYGASVGTTVPSAFYGLVLTKGGDPSIIGAVWWNSISVPNKIFSIVNAATILAIGTLSRLKYFPEAVVQLKSILKSYTESFTQFAKNNTILLLAIASAIAAGALAYDSFIWSGELAAILSALANVVVVGGIRIVSLSSLFLRINALFDKDEQFRRICIKQLKSLKCEYQNEINELLADQDFNEVTAQQFLSACYDKALLVEKEKNYTSDTDRSIFETKTKLAYSLELGCDTVLAAGFGAAFFTFFGIKGIDGVKIIARLCGLDYVKKIESLSCATSLAFVFTGLASGALAVECGLETREHEYALYRQLKKHPEDIIKAVTLLFFSGLSATSVTAAALSITEKPNLFNLETWSVSGSLFILLNTLLFIAFDFNAASAQVIPPRVEDVTQLDKFVEWLEKNKPSLKEVQKHGYFARPVMDERKVRSFPSPSYRI